MKIKDQAAMDKWQKNNQDFYIAGIVSYAIRWAELMEAAMTIGDVPADIIAACAKRTSREADVEGITGYMYGVAVSVLASTWEYGDELRRWHNLDTQIGTEGERANESGGILNPALWSVKL